MDYGLYRKPFRTAYATKVYIRALLEILPQQRKLLLLLKTAEYPFKKDVTRKEQISLLVDIWKIKVDVFRQNPFIINMKIHQTNCNLHFILGTCQDCRGGFRASVPTIGAVVEWSLLLFTLLLEKVGRRLCLCLCGLSD